jgi:hypothetical protein
MVPWLALSFTLAVSAQGLPVPPPQALPGAIDTKLLSHRPPSAESLYSLRDAPTSRAGAVWASAGATVVGAGMGTGFVLLMFFNQQATIPTVSGAVLGFALLSFGPGLGHLINGDTTRFWLGGLSRLVGAPLAVAAVGLLSLLGVPVVAAWLAWTLFDCADAWNAPKRWVDRTNRVNVPFFQMSF